MRCLFLLLALDSLAQAAAPATVRGKAMTPERFRKLADQWAQETAFLSSPPGIARHPAALEILAAGAEALPLLMAEVEAGRELPAMWLLPQVAGTDPVPASDRGKIDRMASAWLAWWKARK